MQQPTVTTQKQFMIVKERNSPKYPQIDYFAVVALVPPSLRLNVKSEVDLVLIQTFFTFLWKLSVSIGTT